MSLHRIESILKKINKIGYSDKGMNRLAFTEMELQVKSVFSQICKEAGLSVRMDESGNVIARREGTNPHYPPITLGSHLDTVINGGQYDGTVGIVAAIEVIYRLNERNIKTVHPVEIICFTAEESSRFGMSTIGSKFMTGKLKKEDVTHLKDKNNINYLEALKEMGLNPDIVNQSSRENEEIAAFFEVHIEQGPILENDNIDIGIVTGIAAPTRLNVTIKGKSDHSGTTPMGLRKDALIVASELILFVERVAKFEADKGSVATVGDCVVSPGAMNVIPGMAELKIDIRSTEMESKENILHLIKNKIKDLERERSVMVYCDVIINETPVLLKEKVIQSLSNTCETLGISFRMMPSGAGHDAMNMASICDTGVIFIPCKDGLSHHPNEYTSLENIKNGCDVLEFEMLKWAIKK